MSATIINIIIQLIAGIIGGNAAGSGIKNISLGTAGNTIAGALGGLGGGQLLGPHHSSPPRCHGWRGRHRLRDRAAGRQRGQWCHPDGDCGRHQEYHEQLGPMSYGPWLPEDQPSRHGWSLRLRALAQSRGVHFG